MVARKPLSESTVANNVLQWGTGGLNIDASRIGNDDTRSKASLTAMGQNSGWNKHENREVIAGSASGRFPANFILSHSEDCEPLCAEGCPVAELDKQSGTLSPGHWAKTKVTGFGDFGNGSSDYQGVGEKAQDKGGASRFFYVAKASKKDRNEGLDGLPEKPGPDGMRRNLEAGESGGRGLDRSNFHPTVKPTQLMEYLIKLVTPEGGTVLDPFTGSGSTGKAALLNGFKFIGCELTEDYLPIIEGRLSWASANKDKYQADKVAAVTKANKVAQNTRSKATGGSLTALDAAEVALQQIAAKKANKADNQLPLFDEVEESE